MSDPLSDPPGPDDQRWFTWASFIVAGVLAFSMAVGLVLLPIAQAPNAGIDAWTAICRAVGVSPGTPAQPQPPVSATAAPVSQVEWSPRTLKILASADSRPGAALAASVCASCHGEEGMSITDEFPRLAGQSPASIYKQLSDYRSGARRHEQMTKIARDLTPDQLAQIASYYGQIRSGVALGTAGITPGVAPGIEHLIYRGDPRRHIAPCESCHARGAGGPPEAPVIKGQNAAYIERQLLGFKTGERRNDVYERMRGIAGQLSHEEIRLLAQSYQGTY